MIFKNKMPVGSQLKAIETARMVKNLPPHAERKIIFDEIERHRLFKFDKDIKLVGTAYTESELQKDIDSNLVLNMNRSGTFIVNSIDENLSDYNPMYSPSNYQEYFSRFYHLDFVDNNSQNTQAIMYISAKNNQIKDEDGTYKKNAVIKDASLNGICKVYKNQSIGVFNQHTAESIIKTTVSTEAKMLEIDIETSIKHVKPSPSVMTGYENKLNITSEKTSEVFIDDIFKYPPRKENGAEVPGSARTYALSKGNLYAKFYNSDGTFVMAKLSKFGQGCIQITKDNEVKYNDGENTTNVASINPPVKDGFKIIRFALVVTDFTVEYRNVVEVDGVPMKGPDILLEEYISFTFNHKIIDIKPYDSKGVNYNLNIDDIIVRHETVPHWNRAYVEIPHILSNTGEFPLKQSRIDFSDGVEYKWELKENDNVKVGITEEAYSTLRNDELYLIPNSNGLFVDKLTNDVHLLKKYEQKLDIITDNLLPKITQIVDNKKYTVAYGLSDEVNSVTGVIKLNKLEKPQMPVKIVENYKMTGIDPNHLLPLTDIEVEKLYAIHYKGKYHLIHNSSVTHVDTVNNVVIVNASLPNMHVGYHISVSYYNTTIVGRYNEIKNGIIYMDSGLCTECTMENISKATVKRNGDNIVIITEEIYNLRDEAEEKARKDGYKHGKHGHSFDNRLPYVELSSGNIIHINIANNLIHTEAYSGNIKAINSQRIDILNHYYYVNCTYRYKNPETGLVENWAGHTESYKTNNYRYEIKPLAIERTTVDSLDNETYNSLQLKYETQVVSTIAPYTSKKETHEGVLNGQTTVDINIQAFGRAVEATILIPDTPSELSFVVSPKFVEISQDNRTLYSKTYTKDSDVLKYNKMIFINVGHPVEKAIFPLDERASVGSYMLTSAKIQLASIDFVKDGNLLEPKMAIKSKRTLSENMQNFSIRKYGENMPLYNGKAKSNILAGLSNTDVGRIAKISPQVRANQQAFRLHTPVPLSKLVIELSGGSDVKQSVKYNCSEITEGVHEAVYRENNVARMIVFVNDKILNNTSDYGSRHTVLCGKIPMYVGIKSEFDFDDGTSYLHSIKEFFNGQQTVSKDDVSKDYDSQYDKNFEIGHIVVDFESYDLVHSIDIYGLDIDGERVDVVINPLDNSMIKKGNLLAVPYTKNLDKMNVGRNFHKKVFYIFDDLIRGQLKTPKGIMNMIEHKEHEQYLAGFGLHTEHHMNDYKEIFEYRNIEEIFGTNDSINIEPMKMQKTSALKCTSQGHNLISASWKIDVNNNDYMTYFIHSNEGVFHRIAINGKYIEHIGKGRMYVIFDKVNNHVQLKHNNKMVDDIPVILKDYNNNLTFELFNHVDCIIYDLLYTGKFEKVYENSTLKNKEQLFSWGDDTTPALSTLMTIPNIPNKSMSTIRHFYDNNRPIVQLVSKTKDVIKYSYNMSIQNYIKNSYSPSDVVRGIVLTIDYSNSEGNNCYIDSAGYKIPLQSGEHKYKIKIYTLHSHKEHYNTKKDIGSIWTCVSIDEKEETHHLACMAKDFEASNYGVHELSHGNLNPMNNVHTVLMSVSVVSDNTLSNEESVTTIVSANYIRPTPKIDWNVHTKHKDALYNISAYRENIYMVIGLDDSEKTAKHVPIIISSLRRMYEASERYNFNINIAVGKLWDNMFLDNQGNNVSDKVFWLQKYKEVVGAINSIIFPKDQNDCGPVNLHKFNTEVFNSMSKITGKKSVKVYVHNEIDDAPTLSVERTKLINGSNIMVNVVSIDTNQIESIASQIGYSKILYSHTLDCSHGSYSFHYDYLRLLNGTIYPYTNKERLGSTTYFDQNTNHEYNTICRDFESEGYPELINNMITGQSHELHGLYHNCDIAAPIMIERLKSSSIVTASGLAYKENTSNDYYPYMTTYQEYTDSVLELGYTMQKSTKLAIEFPNTNQSGPGVPIAAHHLSNLVLNDYKFREFYRKDVEIHDLTSTLISVAIMRAEYTDEIESEFKNKIVKLIENAKIGDIFDYRIADDERVVSVLNSTVIDSEKRRLELIDTVKRFSFERGTCTSKSYELIANQLNKDYAIESIFTDEMALTSVFHYVIGPVQSEWEIDAFTINSQLRSHGCNENAYYRTYTTTYIDTVKGSKPNYTNIIDDFDNAIELHNSRRPKIAKTTMCLDSNTPEEVAEIVFDTTEWNDNHANDPQIYMRFFGMVERDGGTQGYHVGVMAYGKLICLLLDNEMKEYELIIKNPHNSNFNATDPLVSAFRMPEENTNPLLIEKAPVMVIDDFDMLDVNHRYNGKYGMVYAKNANILIDEVSFEVNKSFYKPYNTAPERESRFDKHMSSIAYITNKNKDSYSGKSSLWNRNNDCDNDWGTVNHYKDYSAYEKPVNVKWRLPNNIEYVLPKFPPKTTENEINDYIDNVLYKDGYTTENDPDMFDPDKRISVDKNNNPTSPIMPDEVPKFLDKEKEICSSIQTFDFPKSGSYDVTDETVEVFMDTFIKQDTDIRRTLSSNLLVEVLEYIPKDDYPFVESSNPYDDSVPRFITKNHGDISVFIVENSPVKMIGGWIGQLHTGEHKADIKISHKMGLVPILKKQDIAPSLKNIYGHVYEGTADATISTVNVSHPDEVIINDIPKDDIILRADSTEHYTTQKYKETFTDDHHVFDIIPSEIFELPEFEAEYRLEVDNETDNVFINNELVDKGDMIEIDSVNTPINISAGHYVKWVNWTGNKLIKSYIINGDDYLSEPEAGEKDINDTLKNMDKPKDARNYYISAEIDSEKPVQFKFGHPLNNNWFETQTPNDNYTLAINYTEDFEFTKTWVGPTLERKFSTDSKLQQTISVLLRNPEMTMNIDGVLENINVEIKPDNPNIKVLNYVKEISFNGSKTIEWPVTVKPVVSEIAKWHPVIHSGYYYMNNHEMYYYANPSPKKGRKTGKLPVHKDVTITVKMYLVNNKMIEVSKIVKLLFDGKKHLVFNEILENAVYTTIVSHGLKQKDIVEYFIDSDVDNAEFEYSKNGSSKLYFTSTTIEEFIGELAYYDFNEINECVVSPVPQQFAPVILTDEKFGSFKRVNFLDNNGNLTLKFEETVYGDGTRTIPMTYTDIDKNTLVIKINEDELTEYEIYNNIIVVPFLIKPNTEIKISYKLKNSFIVNYNFDTFNNKAKITAHASEQLEKALVTYESESDSPGRYAEELNLNTLYNPDNEGFIYIASEENFCEYVEVNINPLILSSTGADKTNVYIRSLDKLGNPVQGNTIIVDCKYGKLKVSNNKTDNNGIVKCTYYAPSHPCPNGSEVVTVTNLEANIVTTVNLTIM